MQALYQLSYSPANYALSLTVNVFFSQRHEQAERETDLREAACFHSEFVRDQTADRP